MTEKTDQTDRTDKTKAAPTIHERDEDQLETYAVHRCEQCGAELPVLAECYPTKCGACGGNTFYAIQPRKKKPDKAAFLPNIGVIDDYML